VRGAEVVAELVRHDEGGDRGAEGMLAQRDAELRVADGADVRDAGGGAVEVLAGDEVRETARAHGLGRLAKRAQLFEQHAARGAAQRVGVEGHESQIGREHEDADLFAVDALDDVEAREQRGGGIGFRLLELGVPDHRDLDLAADLRRHAGAQLGDHRAIVVEAVGLFAGDGGLEAADLAGQAVAEVGEAVGDGLVRRHVERGVERGGHAVVARDGIQLLAVPDRAFGARGRADQADPGSGPPVDGAAQQAVVAQFGLAGGAELGQDAVVVGEGQVEAAAVGLEMRGPAGDGEIHRFNILNDGLARGLLRHGPCRDDDTTQPQPEPAAD
jgi:hypothetical protein